MRTWLARVIVLGAALAAVAGCAAGNPFRGGQIPPEMLAAAPATAYRLGPGDSLRVSVFGQAILSGDFTIDGSGVTSMPLIGEVTAEGLTVREFEAAVEDRLRGDYLTDPQVNAEVTNFRPYYIYGEISSPGQYPYVDGMTVIKAVAIAGGFTPRSDTRVVFIQSADGVEEERKVLTPNTPLMPGDTVRLRERFF